MEACTRGVTKRAAFLLAKPQAQIPWTWECVIRCPNQKAEPCLRDLPELSQVDVPTNYALPHRPVPLTPLGYCLDLLTLILYVPHLSNNRLLPLFPAGLGPELWDFSMPKACPSCLNSADDLFLLQPAYCLVNFGMGFPFTAVQLT